MQRLSLTTLIVIAAVVLTLTGTAQAELLGYLDFNEETDGTVSSQGVVPLSGTLEGGAKLDNIDATRPAFLTGKYLVLDGDNDHVDLGNSDSLNFDTGNWSVAAWMKSSNGDDKGTIFGNGGDDSGGIRYAIIVSESNKTRPSLILDDNSSKKQAHAGAAITDGAWHHVVGLRDGDEMRIYVDGVLDKTTGIDAGYDLTGIDQHPAYIGAITHNGDGTLYKFFQGSLDDVAVWDEALPDSYIAGLADGTINPSVPVPEPSVLLLSAIGLLGFWLRRKV